MTSIDEAIAQEKELSGHCKRMFDDMNEVDKLSNKLLKNEIEYHEQLAEWLEELKDYRDKNKIVVRVDVENMDSIKDKIDELSKYAESQYNKALDDFVKFASTMPTVEQKDGTIRPMWLKEMAEQLKAGAV